MKRKHFILIPIIILFFISIIYLPDSLRIKQLIWISTSLLLYFIISKINFKRICKYSIIYYCICLFLLVLVLILNNYINGSRAWINFGFFSLQPSELMKIALIIIGIKYYKKINSLLLLVVFTIPIILIFLEPDTGGIISIIIILLILLSKKLEYNNKRMILFISFIIILLVFLIYYLDKDILIKIFGPSIFYRLDRINSFINDDNIQTINSLISVATGNLLYFPEMFNDFFVAYILSKNIYLVFVIIICTITILFLLKNKNTLVSQVAFYLILWQCWWNLAMNLKLVPVIGIPHLFLSYGGSHIIISMILIGLTNSNEYNKNLDNMDMVD